jgi:trehalose 6-phosphate phosphatase
MGEAIHERHGRMTPGMEDMDQLINALDELSRASVLLVASDYDGTMAPIVDDPAEARPHHEAIVAMRLAGALPQTYAAIISGRALVDLGTLTGYPENVHLVGSHGSEFDVDFADTLDADQTHLRERLIDELEAVASGHEGFLIEKKPASIAFHYRNAPEAAAMAALESILSGPAMREGVHVKRGKMVVELSVVQTHKGMALDMLRHRFGATAVIFVGDDHTDEDAFATLQGPDIAIKVGDGDTAARYRVDGPEDVARVLANLSEKREHWLAGSHAVPIEHHSMLSDQRALALVTPTARLTWMCAPRIDSSAIFAELLGGPSAGYFTIEPDDGGTPQSQAYAANTMVLQTTWNGATLTDLLDCSSGRPSQRSGRTDLIRHLSGAGRFRIEFAPRLDFGRLATALVPREDGLEVAGSIDSIVLRSRGVQWRIENEGRHQTAYAMIDLSDGPRTFELRYGTGHLRDGRYPLDDRMRLTERYWASWAESLMLPSVADVHVRRSALLLKGLCYGPSGAIAAAGTASLPEYIGGVRNWDYRYCWFRDAAMSASSLVRLGSFDEAMKYLDWVLGVVDQSEHPERIHPLYSVSGHPLSSEAEISELAGYAGSRPVRVGNAAARQVQLDVFGPIVDLIAQLSYADAPLSSRHWRLVEAMVHAVEQRWFEPDHGIWEIRAAPRHHVHSKVMCWLTVDRAIHIAHQFLERERTDWQVLRDTIAHDVISNGYKNEVSAFTAAYDGIDLDAAALFVGLSGLLPPDDERFTNTIAAIEHELFDHRTVYRYRADDGLPGFEGGFHICLSWLIEAYVKVGRLDDAWRCFDILTSLIGPTGLLSEQYDPVMNRALGNVPQAYSHLGLIDNALLLSAHPRPS